MLLIGRTSKINTIYRVKSGTVKDTNYKTNEEYKIKRILDLINAPKNAAYTGKEAMEKYN